MSSLPPPPAHPSGPTAGREREPIIDLLRGFALLGILVINVELMRGPGFYHVLAGRPAPAGSGADELTDFLSGWLASGKFISSFALLFGVGAALLVTRAKQRAGDPRQLLTRRYTLLLVLGLLHMFLLFPGDILFAYGIAGLVLLAFLEVRPRTALRWSAGIYAVLAVATGGFAALTLAFAQAAGLDDPDGIQQQLFGDRAERAVSAYADGGWLDLLGAHAFEAVILQAGHVATVPWILAIFLLGYAVGRSGIAADLAGHRRLLSRAAAIGLGLGLPLNLPMGLLGPLGVGAAGSPDWVEASATFLQFVAPPVLAVGYLATVALIALHLGAWQPLAAVGRMALTAYLLQSVFSVAVFKVAGLYGQVSSAQALVFVVGTWGVLLVICPLWLRAFRFGPVEWLWRSWTYGSRQPLRATAD